MIAKLQALHILSHPIVGSIRTVGKDAGERGMPNRERRLAGEDDGWTGLGAHRGKFGSLGDDDIGQLGGGEAEGEWRLGRARWVGGDSDLFQELDIGFVRRL